MPDRPLVSFILISYNQERFIREAVAGAFSQTYSPLEVVICDDCSLDHTFEIIKEMAAAYQGPHKIILHRNQRNLGICGNVNKAVELSHGELIVAAAGDDISLPHRCARIVEEWVQPGRRWHSLCSNAEIIDKAGKQCGPYREKLPGRDLVSVDQVLASGIVGVAGCTHAFSRETFDVFGPLDVQSPGEDEVIGFRSLVLGGVCWISDRLVLYRRHPENTFKTLSDVQSMPWKRRKKLMANDKNTCALLARLQNETLQLAEEKRILTPEMARHYANALSASFPMLQFVVVYNKHWRASLSWMMWAVLTGKYRPGMFSMFECEHLHAGFCKLLRFCRKPAMPRRM
jgi:glycosyltransferase involved in cell wall biosynthesis